MKADDLIQAFNAESVDRGEITRAWYGARIKPYLVFLEANGNDFSVTGPAHVKQFLASLREQGYSWSTRNGSHTALNEFYKWAVLRGLAQANPFQVETIKRPRRPRRIREHLETETLALILQAIRQDDSLRAKRDYALMLLLADTGMRRFEAVSLNIQNVNIKDGVVDILIAKGGNQRKAYINPPVIQAIETWLKVHPKTGPKDPLFISLRGHTIYQRLSARRVNGILLAWSKMAGLEKPLKPHDMRRIFASVFAEAGGGISILQSLLGHQQMQTTQGYITIGEKEKRRQHQSFSVVNHLNL